MGCLSSKELTEEAKTSHAIDLQIKQDAHAERAEIKLLLLGAGESGKTTIRNQMRFLEGQPMSETEKDQFTDVCRTNLISSLQTILDNMLLLSVSLADPALKESANLIISLENEFGSVGVDEGTGELLPGVIDACVALWADANVKHTALERSHEFQLNDSATYFLDEAQRIGAPGWKPNDMDILKARVKTTGISETRFTKGGRNFTVVDVGGQRSERRKWLNCFDSVTSLLYVVALNEYNMMLREDESVNRLREALVLYHSIITSTYFREIPVILFLNKADLLRRKCRSGDSAQLITAYFPEFAIAPNPGGREADPADWKQVFRFIERMFLESHLGPDVKDEKTRQKQIYAHMCTAVDVDNMKMILNNVSDIILRGNLDAAGLI